MKYINKYMKMRYHKDEKFRKRVIETSKKTQKEKYAEWKRLKLCVKCGGKRDKEDRKLCSKCRKANLKRLYKRGRKNAYEEIIRIIDSIKERDIRGVKTWFEIKQELKEKIKEDL